MAVGLALTALSGRAAAEPWTAERVLAAVRRRDPALEAERAAGDAGRAQAAMTWAMLAPRVTLSAGFTRADDPALLFSQKLWQGRFEASDFALDRLNRPEARSALQVGVTIDQPLWNGGRELSAPGLALRRGRAAVAAERAAISTRLLEAIEIWVAALDARGQAEAAELALTAARAMRAATVERFRMGQVPELDTLRAAAREADSRVRALGARRRESVALERLSRTVGEPVAAQDLAVEPGEPPPAAGAERGELVAAREGAAAAATESRTAALRLLPSLHSRFAVNHYRPAGEGGFERRWVVAISAELPVFDGGERVNQWRAARARAEESRARATALERDLAVGLAAARAEDGVALERREAARAGRAAAEEAERLAAQRYRSGLLPFTELLAADAEAGAARSTEVEAATAVLLARYRLLHALGGFR